VVLTTGTMLVVLLFAEGPMDPLVFSSQAEQALASLVGTLRAGNKQDLSTRLVRVSKDGSISEKALARARMAQDIFDACDLGRLPSWLASAEMEKKGKFSTRSRRYGCFTDNLPNDSLDKQARLYFSPREDRVLDGEAVDYANQYVSSFYPVHRYGRLRPLDLDEAAMCFHNSGLGFPVVSSDVGQHFQQVLAISRDIWNSGADPEWISVLPGLPGYRGQPLGPPHEDRNPGGCSKTRLIFMMPRALANLEKCIQKPLFDELKSNPTFCAWQSAEHVDREVTRLLTKGKRILSIDFKRFDTSIPFSVMSKVYAIYRSWFVPEAAPLINFCEEVVKRSGIILPDGDGEGGDYVVLPGSSRTRGMPSGCVMTNMTDSNVNAWVMAYSAKRLKCRISAGYFQGDDGLISFDGDPSLADLSGVLSTELGMTLSADKCSYEKDQVTFLQNVHHRSYLVDSLNRGVRLIMHATNAMSSHERVDDAEYRADDFDTIRYAQQAGYCLHHPSATQLCDWLGVNDDFARVNLARVKRDPDYFSRACEAVRRKDSNSQKGFSPNALLSSPVFQYLLSKV